MPRPLPQKKDMGLVLGSSHEPTHLIFAALVWKFSGRSRETSTGGGSGYETLLCRIGDQVHFTKLLTTVEGGRDGWREGWMEGWREGGRDGWMEGGREGGRGGREGGREGRKKEVLKHINSDRTSTALKYHDSHPPLESRPPAV